MVDFWISSNFVLILIRLHCHSNYYGMAKLMGVPPKHRNSREVCRNSPSLNIVVEKLFKINFKGLIIRFKQKY